MAQVGLHSQHDAISTSLGFYAVVHDSLRDFRGWYYTVDFQEYTDWTLNLEWKFRGNTALRYLVNADSCPRAQRDTVGTLIRLRNFSSMF